MFVIYSYETKTFISYDTNIIRQVDSNGNTYEHTHNDE